MGFVMWYVRSVASCKNFYRNGKIVKGPESKYANTNIKRHISAEVDFSIVLLFINMGGGRMIYEE